MKNYLIYIILVILSSCNQKPTEILSEEGININLSSSKEISSVDIKMEFLIDQIDDYLITVGQNSTNLITIYHKKTLEKSFEGLNFGEGPSDIAVPISLDVVGRDFFIRDGGFAKLLKFNIDSIILKNEVKPIKTIKTPVTGDVIISILPIDNYFLATTESKNNHFISFTEDGNITEEFGKFEEKEILKNLPEVLYGSFYKGRYSYDRHKKKIIKSQMDHDQIKFFNLQGYLEKKINTGDNFNNIIKFDNRRIIKPDRIINYLTYPYVSEKKNIRFVFWKIK